jgi:putative hemolysin
MASRYRQATLAAALAAAFLLTLAACEGPYGREVPNVPAEAIKLMGLGNPALSWCQDAGADLVNRRGADGKEIATCVFPNGEECAAELTARGLCRPGVVGPSPGRSR